MMRPVWSRLKRGLPHAVFGTAVAALLVMFGPIPLAHAETPAEIEKQIDVEWHKLEPMLEKHNTIKVQLSDNKARAEQIAEKIKPLQQQLDAAMTRVSELSAAAYKGNQASAINAILAGGTASTVVEKLTMLEAMAKIQSDQVADAVKLKREYDAEKQPYDDLVAKFGAQEAEIAALRKASETGIANLNRMRLVAYGTTADIGELRPAPCPVSYDGSPGAKAAQLACAQIGKPYVFATAGLNTFDCSGLVKYTWAAQGVNLAHSSSIQYAQTTHISRAQLRIGALVFFYGGISHVGIYVGDNWMVEAANVGIPIKMSKIDSYPIYGFSDPGL